MSDNNQLSQEQYESMLAHVAELGVRYIQTGLGRYFLRDAFNDLCERSGANRGINHECTIGRQKLLAQSICIKAIPCLDRVANDRRQKVLDEMSEDYSPTRSRGIRR